LYRGRGTKIHEVAHDDVGASPVKLFRLKHICRQAIWLTYLLTGIAASLVTSKQHDCLAGQLTGQPSGLLFDTDCTAMSAWLNQGYWAMLG
jgi:hypothetical protein